MTLRQSRVVDEFMMEFQMIAIMIHHILEERLAFLFIEGLMEPLRGMVKVSSLRSLNDAIREAYDLEPTVKSLRVGSISKGFVNQKLFAEGPSKEKTLPRSMLD